MQAKGVHHFRDLAKPHLEACSSRTRGSRRQGFRARTTRPLGAHSSTTCYARARICVHANCGDAEPELASGRPRRDRHKAHWTQRRTRRILYEVWIVCRFSSIVRKHDLNNRSLKATCGTPTCANNDIICRLVGDHMSLYHHYLNRR